MLFTTILLVFAAAIPVFSAPVPSTELARRQGSAGAAVVPRQQFELGTTPDGNAVDVSPGVPAANAGCGAGR